MMEEALCAGDVVGGGRGARDGFGAYGIEGIVAVIVSPCSIHVHAVSVPVRLTLVPVCVRATVVYYGAVVHPPADEMRERHCIKQG